METVLKKKVILFGAGSLGERSFEYLSKHYEIVAFCDNDVAKIGKTINGKKVISYDDAIQRDAIIIITSSFYLEITMQLLNNNITNFKVFRIVNDRQKTFEDRCKIIDMTLSKNITDNHFFISTVSGFLSVDERNFLIYFSNLIKDLDGDYVEIGSYKGRSAICFGLGNILFNNRMKKIYCIDTFSDNYFSEASYFNEFMMNIRRAGLEEDVIPIKKLSSKAVNDVPRNIAAIFIDGDHTYESVEEDIRNYQDKIVIGGYMVFHDYGRWGTANKGVTIDWGVTKAVDEFLENNGDFEYVCDCNSIRVLRRIK